MGGDRWKQIAFAVTPALLLLAISEIAARAWLGNGFHGVLATPAAIRSLVTPSPRVTAGAPLIRFDPEVGYACLPGKHEVVVHRGAAAKKFTATIGQDGLRIAAATDGAVNRPEVWILGCSFTWGYMLNDNETFPWLIQEHLPDAHVRNFGCNGCGTIQQLLYLRRTATHRENPPAVAVFVYNPFHLERNTLSDHVYSMFQMNQQELNLAGYPVTSLQPGGAVDVRIVPVFSPEGVRLAAQPGPEPLALAQAILGEIRNLCDRMRIRPIFAVQSGVRDVGLPVHARKLGFEVVDISVPLESAQFTFLPLDPHPNAQANQRYAQNLLPVILSALTGTSSVSR